MGHAVAQQVLERAGHALQHAAVHFGAATDDVQAHLLARFLGRLAHHAVEALGEAFELHHAGAQQVVLQVARQAGLGHELVFGGFQAALQGALHGGHVVDRLGHHPGEFLEARVAVELQRVELLGGGPRGFHPGGDLGLGLQLDVAQLLTQAVEVLGQVGQGTTDLADLALQA